MASGLIGSVIASVMEKARQTQGEVSQLSVLTYSNQRTQID